MLMKCGRCLEVNPCDCYCHKSDSILSDHYNHRIEYTMSEKAFKKAQRNHILQRFGWKQYILVSLKIQKEYVDKSSPFESIKRLSEKDESLEI